MKMRLSKQIELPPPRTDSNFSLEKSLYNRRSVRSFKKEPVTLQELSQLLWAAQGESNARGYRTAPSAGALYPLEVHAVAGNVTGLSPGIYRYVPTGHSLLMLADGDRRQELCDACLSQPSVRTAAVDIVITAIFSRTTSKYGERGDQYVHMEAGHASQNISLQAVSLGLGTVVIGAFRDGKVQAVIGLEASEQPLIIMPVGRR